MAQLGCLAACNSEAILFGLFGSLFCLHHEVRSALLFDLLTKDKNLLQIAKELINRA
jgi:hypothetical protein